MSKRIGIFGGSFDPIHHGHLIAARDAMENMRLDKVIFVPAKVSPHKLGTPPTPFAHRLNMVELAISGIDGWSVDCQEGDRSGPSYAIDTAEKIKTANPNSKLFYLIGDDQLERLHTWERYDDLKQQVKFLVMRRHNKTDIGRSLHISSTEIRERVKARKPINFLTTDRVISYIKELNLYKQ